MISILIALALSFTLMTSTEVPVSHTTPAMVEVAQTPQEQALEASAWESFEMAGVAETFTGETIASYSHTVTVEDGPYTVGLYQFEVVDAYDDVYIHIFTVDTLYHA